MLYLVTGGSGSGKSQWAEEQTVTFGEETRYYIATMICGDEESKERIRRHRLMRADRHFHTLECPRDLQEIRLPNTDSVVLLEDLSNLTANEFFDGREHAVAEIRDKVVSAVESLKRQCRHMVVVSNEIFSDGADLDEYSLHYVNCLGEINGRVAEMADVVAEVVYGIPVLHQGSIASI